ncbi:MAG: hypothetical protein JWN04_846 [Myxococcaceae bacterium]|nr:hypothetical protein [Myxococcaceae bacterium]
MSTQIPLRCECGSIRGTALDIAPHTGTRLICYCDDCQQFARYLGKTDVLDTHGGTDILHLAPAQLRITQGSESLRCVRLSPKGLLRWYAGCCNTPIGNTMAKPGMPFVGLVHAFMDHAGDARSRDEVLGPPRGRIHGRFARGGLPAGAHPKAPLKLIAGIGARMLAAWIARKQAPSPFFAPHTGAPVVEPVVLTKEQRSALV